MTISNGSAASAPSKLFPVVIDQRARETPDRVYAITPRTSKLEDGYTETTYGQVGRAINKFSWWLDEKLGKSTGFQTISYIGPRDLRYAFVVVAAAKTSRQVLLPLSQNSFEALMNLINTTNPQAVIGTKDMMSVWDKVRAEKPDLIVLEAPELEELYRDTPTEVYPYNKTWEEAKNDPIHINHTSGTTGLPKPVRWTNVTSGLIADLQAANNLPAGEKPAWSILADKKVFLTMPPEWIAGLAMVLHLPLLLNTIPIMVPTEAPHPMTAPYMDRVHQLFPDIDSGFYVPDLLKQLTKTPKYLEHMKNIKFITFAGAPLDKNVGDIFSKWTKVQSMMGTTEVGLYPLKVSDPVLWNYYRFDLDHPTGIKLVPYADDRYELVVKKIPGNEDYQPAFKLFPDVDVYHTKDLFAEHPERKGLWLFSGRTDDFVKLSNLTKFNASHVESLIDRHPRIRDTIMGGEGRKRPFFLVQLKDDDEQERDAVIDELWPAFEEANKHIANDIQLRKELVLLTKPGKPIRKIGKGTVNRRETLRDYEEEIKKLYEDFGEP